MVAGIINVVFKARNDFDVDKVLTAESLQALDDVDLFPNEVSHIYLLEVPGMLRFTAKEVVVGRKRVVYFAKQASEYLNVFKCLTYSIKL